MDFDQLNAFVAVARFKSFSRAAETCFRTQPAISSQIRALEEEVGAKLFDRSGGRVSLTAPGKAFLTYAEETLEAKRWIIAALAEMDRVPRGEIVVGANEGTCLHILPDVFAEFKRRYPDVSVSVSRSERAGILDDVLNNTVDFGIVSMPVDDNRLRSVVVHRDELVVITAPEHPFNHGKMRAMPLTEVVKYPLLLPKVGRTRDALEEMFQKRRLKPNISMELESSEVLKKFVAAGVGIGFIGKSNVLGDVKAKTLCALPMEDVTIRRDLALVHRKDKALSRAARAFIEIAVKITAPKAANGK
jgi:LysR family transcriptional regulator, low CO2-responsive transcriptional regulator